MKNLNSEQVTKALGCCVIGDCEPCAYRSFVGCRDSMCGDALALITSQEQKIKELTEENERLIRHTKMHDEIIADTVKKMQDKVHEICIKEGFSLDLCGVL